LRKSSGENEGGGALFGGMWYMILIYLDLLVCIFEALGIMDVFFHAAFTPLSSWKDLRDPRPKFEGKWSEPPMYVSIHWDLQSPQYPRPNQIFMNSESANFHGLRWSSILWCLNILNISNRSIDVPSHW
jgi:hypothetical protein